jgi:hypothetical protein
MPAEDPQAKAHQAIGAYFCAFSVLELELGETIKVVFQLQDHPAADAIVAALSDVSRKINLVWSSTQLAKNANGSDASADWKKSADTTMDNVWKCNDERNLVAHSFLQAEADASVKLVRLKLAGGKIKGQGEPVTWTQEIFGKKIARLNELAEKIRTMKSELQRLTIPLPDLSWLAGDSYQPYKIGAAARYLYYQNQADTPLPLKVGEQEKQGDR